MPVELVFEVFGYLDTANLRTVSLVSRRSNELAIPILWRSFRISDSGLVRTSPTPLHWRRVLAEMCNAVSQNPRRARHVRQITINITGSSLLWTLFGSSVMRSLSRALCAVESLESLVAHLPDRDTQRGRAAMVSMLCSQPSQFGFRLRQFECDALMEPEIFPFLLHQQHIERYAVRRSLRPQEGDGVLHDATNTRRRSHSLPSRLTSAGPAVLPSLMHFTGPPAHVRNMLKGRHMETVHVYCDAPPVEAAELATMMPSQAMTLDRVRARALAHTERLVLSRGWSLERETPVDFAAAIEHVYGIAPESLKNLCFEYFLIREVDIPHNFELLAPEILKNFSSLETLEWNCCFFGDFQGERHGVPRNEFSEEWATQLVRRCEASCPSLRSLSITRMSSPVLNLSRMEGQRRRDSDNDGDESDCYSAGCFVVLQGSQGRQWVFTISTPSLQRQYSR